MRTTEQLITALIDCAIDQNNPDTCGVCHKHFVQCEWDILCVGDETDEHDISVGRELACPGARARVLLTQDEFRSAGEQR